MVRGKSRERRIGEGGAKLPDWEGQPIRNLRSIKLEWEVRTRLSFIDARAFLLLPSHYSVLFFLILVLALPCCSFIRPSRSSSQPLLHLKELADTPFGFPERLDINRR